MSGIQEGAAPENGVSSEVGVDLEQVVIFDTTMRDGEQSPGASMTLDEKLEIALLLEDMGVDVIEAGFAIASRGDFEAITKACHMRVHHHAFIDVECVAENHIGRLAAHTSQRHQIRHGLRHFTFVVLHQCAAGVLDAFGFVAKEANAPDVVLQFLQWHRGKVSGFFVFLKQKLIE